MFCCSTLQGVLVITGVSVVAVVGATGAIGHIPCVGVGCTQGCPCCACGLYVHKLASAGCCRSNTGLSYVTGQLIDDTCVCDLPGLSVVAVCCVDCSTGFEISDTFFLGLLVFPMLDTAIIIS